MNCEFHISPAFESVKTTYICHDGLSLQVDGLYISKELKLDVIYLSPMHIAQRIIIGYHLDDNHPTMKDLTKRQRQAHRKKLMDNEKLNISRYILGAMKKIRGNGCILAAYHFG